MFLLISSFLAGVLTSLAPCILPLLPVIIGSSVIKGGNKKQDKLKPYIIVASLVVSVIIFTLLLKVSTVLIGVDPQVWLVVSGVIVILIGVTMFLPNLWLRLSSKIGFEHSSNNLLAKAYKQKGLAGPILTGAALGPVFSSCSPVYALVLATVLPVNLTLGLVYISAYAIGLGLALLAISLAGRKFISKLGWAVNPNGLFRKILAIILIAVGLLIVSGNDKKFQAWTAEHLPFGTSQLEEKLLPDNGGGAAFDIEPYKAPELTGIVDWINTNPLTLEELKGKVVLIDFWTYSCINCVRTQPYLNSWYDKYNDDGFVIIGVHAPEFAFEKVLKNVQKGVKDADIKYPVALDNNFATWRAYENQFWPAKYLIDKNGQVRYTHFGEGKYDETESAIQTLLKENGQDVSDSISQVDPGVPVKDGQTPETYLNYSRGERFANSRQFEADKAVKYSLVNDLPEDNWSLGGSWKIGKLGSVAKNDDSVLSLNFSAREVYLVMDGPRDKPVTLKLNEQKVTASQNGGSDVDGQGEIHFDGARLYKLIKLPEFTKNARLDINIPEGTAINALTFGG